MPEIQGQDEALARLDRMAESGSVPSALLLYGPDGVGKKRAALRLAEKLGCGPHDVTVCDPAFQAAVLDIEVEKVRTIRVDPVRELIRRASLRSGSGAWKVFLIDDANLLEVEAANALLKSLEEPEPKTLWVLVTDQRERILPTVRSRCQAVRFSPLSEDLLVSLAQSDLQLELATAARWAPAAEGSLARLARLARFGALADQGRSGPAGYWEVAQGLGRNLDAARETVEGLLDALSAEEAARLRVDPASARIEKAAELLRLKRALKNYTSPALVAQVALLDD